MRLIGHLADEPKARLFGDYLLVQGIENNLEQDAASGWGIWVADEDRLPEAAGLLAEFRANPADRKFSVGARAAEDKRAEKLKEQAQWEKKVRGRREVFRGSLFYGMGPVTIALIAISVIVFAAINIPAIGGWVDLLFISLQSTSLPEVRHGQIWRLVTPIFMHFGFWHIFFNMLWLRDLGGSIESRHGSGYFAVMVLLLGVGSNLVQVYMAGPPQPWMFGGMSGVVYGLLGYIWIRGRFDPGFGIYLHPNTVLFMLIWFAVAFTGVVGNVANWAHAGGLVLGMAWGYITAQQRA